MPEANALYEITADLPSGQWKKTSELAVLRGIYTELRIQNHLLAEAFGQQTMLDSLRQDPTILAPDAGGDS